jgi:hypothetical protein
MSFLSYDVELYDAIVEDAPFVISEMKPSIAATCTNRLDLKYWYDLPYMTVETSKKLVNEMMDYLKKGVIPFTWNGCAFDFPLLAAYSGMVEECAHLALNQVDGMLLVTFNLGYFLSLDAALLGAGLQSKQHDVTLNDGMAFSMTGKDAPSMWQKGEYDAVKTYLAGDVFRPLELITAIEKNGGIKWISKKGKPMFIKTPLTRVRHLFKLKEPDTSWMSSPKPREEFVNWIPVEILNKYGICF